MMPNTFFMSDPHFNHQRMLEFKRSDGSPLRDFKTVEEMNEYMIERCNAVVRPQDRLVCVGDVAMNKKYMSMISKMNGIKLLIMGNHDIYHATEYLQYFENVAAYKIYDNTGIIVSHIPIHPLSKARFKLNIHGHLHSHTVKFVQDETMDDPFYYSVCMEQIDYTPIALDDILKYMDRWLSDDGRDIAGEIL